MRKFTALLGVGALLTILPATPALADGAIIDKDSGTCQGQVPNADGELAGPIVEGSLFVRTNKTWTTLTCHFDLDASLTPDKATHASGFDCLTPALTTDTRASASSGGRMVLTCRIRN